MELHKIPPHNINLEMAVLGAMILDKECAADGKSLNPNIFFRGAHRELLETMKQMMSEAKPIDMLTLQSELMNKGYEYEDVASMEYMNKLTDYGIITSNFKSYVNDLRDLAKKRSAIEKAADIIDFAYDNTSKSEKLDIMFKDSMDEMSRFSPETKFVHIKDVAVDAYEKMEHDHHSSITGIPTGFTLFDKKVTLQKGRIAIISAPPSAGKTTWVTNIAEYMGKNNTVGITVFEQTKEAIVEKMILAKANVHTDYIRRTKEKMEKHHWNKLHRSAALLSAKNIYLEDASNKNVLQMRESIVALKKEHGCDVIVIDYLQLIKDHTIGDRKERIDDKVRELKMIAKELDVLILCISSMNRNQNSRGNKRPVMSDLDGSAFIEYSADYIFFLYRDSMYDDEPKDQEVKGADPVEVIIAKQKDGSTGMLMQYFVMETGKFRE